MEGHLGGRAEKLAKAGRILRTGSRTRTRLPPTRWIVGSATPTWSTRWRMTSRSLDGAADVAVRSTGLREGDDDVAAAGRDREIGLAGGKAGRDRVAERLELGDGVVGLRRVVQRHDDLVLVANDGFRLDKCPRKNGARPGQQRLQTLARQVGFIDLENEVRAAAKIEAERKTRWRGSHEGRLCKVDCGRAFERRAIRMPRRMITA